MKRTRIRQISDTRREELDILTAAQEKVKQRDGYCCVMCGERMWEVAHLVPRWRFGNNPKNWAKKHHEKNLACTCRECHKKTHTFNGRCELLNMLQTKHGYDYSDSPWSQYAQPSVPH